MSLRLDANCPENISSGRSFSTILGVKGANGAGKTHLLKALAFVRNFCVDSFNNDPADLILFSSFFENAQPTEMYVEFAVNDVEYRYELELTDAEVLRETVYRTKSRRSKLFERIGEKLSTPKALNGLQAIKLRKNASLISTAHQYERSELSDIYNFFKSVFTNVGYTGRRDSYITLKFAAQLMDDHKHILNFAKEFIAKCDIGVSDIEIQKEEKEIASGTTRNKEYDYSPFFHHRAKGENNVIHHGTESSGTKTLFRTLAIYKVALDVGGVVVFDEFDLHLHPHILPKIMALFDDKSSNPKNAQLIFTTHDDRVIDILGRYRTVLVNKEENESFAYRLDEIPGDIVRNDRSMLSAYNEGKIGGVPRE